MISPTLIWVKVSLLLGCLVALSVCQRDGTTSWPPKDSEFESGDLTLTGMLLSRYGGHLVVAGAKEVFNLNASTLELLNYVLTGPLNESADNLANLIIYNQSYHEPELVTTCSTSRNYCSVRAIDDLNSTEWVYRRFIENATGAQAFFVDSEHDSVNDSYLFVACPHQKDLDEEGGLCNLPGIFWYKDEFDSGNDEQYPKGFKPDALVKTEQFVAAFAYEKLRLFFSIQKLSNGTRISRVAQVCQYFYYDSVYSKHEYTTKYTYVDMPIECGKFKEVIDVKKVSVDGDTVLVAAFSDRKDSAVCVYNMSHVNQTFVENVKDCYTKNWTIRENDYYFRYQYGTDFPCKKSNPNLTDLLRDNEAYLCNTNNFGGFHHMIGDHKLNAVPTVKFHQSVATSITTATFDSNVIAFVGTDDGNLYKANVFSPAHGMTGEITQPKAYTFSAVKKMLTSANQETIFILTEHKVYRMPVEFCSGFKTCDGCLSSNDPYCGWCLLENRCSRNESCDTRSAWLPSLTDDQCPYVSGISPTIMSIRNLTTVQINVSHPIQSDDISCVFHSDAFNRNYTSNASMPNGSSTLECSPEFINNDNITIEGSINVTISILTSFSDEALVSAYFTLYDCKTFYSCSDCTDEPFSCQWDVYSVKCEYETVRGVNNSKCPRTGDYTVEELQRDGYYIVNNHNDSWFLSKNGFYRLSMTGTNLPVPKKNVTYSCKISDDSSNIVQYVAGNYSSHNNVTCKFGKDEMSPFNIIGELNATVQFMWGNSTIAGEKVKAVLYECDSLPEVDGNCGLCKSYAISQPYYKCHWCESSCIYKYGYDSCSDKSSTCPQPNITDVVPMSAALNSTVLVKISGRNLGSQPEDIASVTIGGINCTLVKEQYIPGQRITCRLEPGPEHRDSGKVKVTLADNSTGEYSEFFAFLAPIISSIEPRIGPYAGGTLVTINGTYLYTGLNQRVYMGEQLCPIKTASEQHRSNSGAIVCETQLRNNSDIPLVVNVSINFDGAQYNGEDDLNFTYKPNPTILDVHPKACFESGGRNLTVNGTNFMSIQKPKVYTLINGKKSRDETCMTISDKIMKCPSPRYQQPVEGQRSKRNTSPSESAKIGFYMDKVSSVLAINLPDDVSAMMYYYDPILYNLTEAKKSQIKEDAILVIEGKDINREATSSAEIHVSIGCMQCDVTDFTTDKIYCKLPSVFPECLSAGNRTHPIQVRIGNFQQKVGEIEYKEENSNKGDTGQVEKIVAGTLIGLLLICLVVTGLRVRKIVNKKKNLEKENLMKMDKLEANFRNQCREEFANLQTVVSDLTSDLEGGIVLFREYSDYADRTLFTSERTATLKHPHIAMSGETERAVETFKGLLRNTQFLKLFIRTLEKQDKFTVHDRSVVATILVAINHDDMEYITGILTSLLSELIEKTVEQGRAKLLLRSSESVAEKLLTHWLSLCLYHHLKGRTGSSLYILYKAIKVQTEKGPIDYLTNCGKYTLSEDKLLAFGDNDINPVTLRLVVKHFIDGNERSVEVNVLDCDNITQAKSKMLEVIYKNVPYSQRPAVHSIALEVREEVTGIVRVLNDEDDSSVTEGQWKNINTLQYYGIEDGETVWLVVNSELEESFKSAGVESPEGFIVGTLKRAKPEVKRISDYNFWHLTKKHQSAEIKPSSDLFLHRLTATKMTIQPYIDDLFRSLLSVDDEPSIIIKYLFDFLDMEALRCGVTDPDVVHTWKCNSVLLRFWVNVIKNPDIVFDVFKPVLVDSCLSVIAQTLMDSSATADLVLSKNSPSNKLLFAKDIPRYKAMVKDYFQKLKEKPAVSDQDLNSFLTQKVSKNFSGVFDSTSALIELYKFAKMYQKELLDEMENLEISNPGTFSSLTMKLKFVFQSMDKGK